MEEDKWANLQGEGYRLENLGRPAVFLLPSHKMQREWSSGVTVERRLHEFLLAEFGGFTSTLVPYFGFWHGGTMANYDECRRYEVSFVGQERIPVLLNLLASIARQIGEECVYFTAGQYACLVYPA